MDSTLIMAADSIFRSSLVCTQPLISSEPVLITSWLILTQSMKTAMASNTEAFP